MRSVARLRCLELVTLLALASSTLGQQTTSPLPPEPTPAQQTNSTNGQTAAPTTSLQTPGAQDSTSNDQEGMFVFKKQVQEVVLHATVVDENRRLAAYLDRSAFSVFEDGRPQTITSFHREDVPVAIGIVIDNSSSMRDKREQVNQAVLNLIRASNPNDEIFVVNFSQNAYLDQDFTSDISLLETALRRTSTQGSTAFYDAIVASAVHLKSNPRLEKKLLLVITDGQDNMSRATLQEATQHLQERNGPTLYAIGLMGLGMITGVVKLFRSSAMPPEAAHFFPRVWTKSARLRERWPTTFAGSTQSRISRRTRMRAHPTTPSWWRHVQADMRGSPSAPGAAITQANRFVEPAPTS